MKHERAVQERLRTLKQEMAALDPLHSNRSNGRTVEFMAVEIETLEWVLTDFFVAQWPVVFAPLAGYLAPQENSSDEAAGGAA